MTPSDILHIRLANQLLSANRLKTPGDVVRHLGGIQAQDYAGGKWSVGLRLSSSKLTDIEKEISEGKIVRTWALRGTLHFLAGKDTRWILELLAPGIIAGLARRYKELELNTAAFRKTNSILAKSLSGNKHLTRNELKTIVEKNGISCAGQRLTFILHRASLDRVICFGVTRGKEQTHALFEEMIPEAKQKGREESLAELTRRYFTSHGPATIQDYMWWSGLSANDAKAGLEMAKSRLVHDEIDGKVYWMPANMVASQPQSRVVHLLPPFDEFLIGYRDRSASIDSVVARQLRTGGMPDATIMIDGKIAGKWNRTIKKDRVVVTMNMFEKLGGEEEQALEEAVMRYSRFIGRKADWTR